MKTVRSYASVSHPHSNTWWIMIYICEDYYIGALSSTSLWEGAKQPRSRIILAFLPRSNILESVILNPTSLATDCNFKYSSFAGVSIEPEYIHRLHPLPIVRFLPIAYFFSNWNSLPDNVFKHHLKKMGTVSSLRFEVLILLGSFVSVHFLLLSGIRCYLLKFLLIRVVLVGTPC